jgi:hypothetical protein
MDTTTIGKQRIFWFNGQHLVESSRYLRILQDRPAKHPANPVVRADQPWEGTCIQLWTAVDHDPASGQWQMWYEGHPKGVVMCTALSDDGIRWRKPDLNQVELGGSTHNNIFLDTSYRDAHSPAVVKAPAGGDPAQRYRMYYWVAPEWHWMGERADHIDPRLRPYRVNGHYLAFSADGIHWTPQTETPVLAGRQGRNAAWGDQLPADERDLWMTIGDTNAVFYDEQTGKYRSYHKLNKMNPGWDLRRRCVGASESDDGIQWSPSISILDPTPEDDAWARSLGGIRAEFYGLHVWPESGFYLGMLWMFQVTKTGEPPFGRGWDDGPITPHLIYSLDGLDWQRLPVREPFIPLGPAGSFEAGTVYSGDRPTVVGDELRFYYHGVSYTHGATDPIDSPNFLTGIAFATLPRDRYVAWQGGTVPGVLDTVPLRFGGSELHLNLDASRGAAKVALLAPDGSALPGYSLEDCDPLASDRIDQTVRWRGRSDLSALQGQPIRLQFWLQHAALYTWQFI